MNWDLYKKHKKKILWAFAINLLIAIPLILPALGKARINTKFGKDKSRLKQIGTSTAMYFTDGDPYLYPSSPRFLDIDPLIIENADQSTWKSISKTSPYYFVPKSNRQYTGSEFMPLAIRKNPLKGYEDCLIVFEDGHVEQVSAADAKRTISFFESLEHFEKSVLLFSKKHF